VFPLVEARSLDRILDYAVPPGMEGTARPGAMVVCPLGPRRVLGVVVGREPPSHEGRLVPLAGVVEGQPVPAELLELAAWMARYYMAPVAACLRLVLPPGGGGALRRDATGEWYSPRPRGVPACTSPPVWWARRRRTSRRAVVRSPPCWPTPAAG
jgi:primosomal protein N'